VHNYERLEKIYYKKKFFKFFIFFLFIIFLIYLIYALLNVKNINAKKHLSEVNRSKISKAAVKKENNLSLKEKNNLKTQKINNLKVKEKNNTKKIVSMTFVLPKIDENETSSVNENKKLVKQSSKITQKNKINKVNDKKFSNNEENNKVKKTHKSLIIEEKANINDLINAYTKKPSFELAINISEYYLNKNDLDLAKLWALKANSINPSRYESWKIFAIILLKKHQKNKAKEVLKTYLNDYGQNVEIKKLLRSIDE
jgi:hypothetical protein